MSKVYVYELTTLKFFLKVEKNAQVYVCAAFLAVFKGIIHILYKHQQAYENERDGTK